MKKDRSKRGKILNREVAKTSKRGRNSIRTLKNSKHEPFNLKKLANKEIIKVSAKFKKRFFIVFGIIAIIIGTINLLMLHDLKQHNDIYFSNSNSPTVSNFDTTNSDNYTTTTPPTNDYITDTETANNNEQPYDSDEANATKLNLKSLIDLISSSKLSLITEDDLRASAKWCNLEDADINYIKNNIKHIYVLNELSAPGFRMPQFIIELNQDKTCTLKYEDFAFDNLLTLTNNSQDLSFDSVFLVKDPGSKDSYSKFLMTTPILNDNTLRLYEFDFRKNTLKLIRTFNIDKCKKKLAPGYSIKYNPEKDELIIKFYCTDTNEGYDLDSFKINLKDIVW